MNMVNIRLEKYPSWPKGHPWKGCRSLTAARGFKSLLLRSFVAFEKMTNDRKNRLTKQSQHIIINNVLQKAEQKKIKKVLDKTENN